MGLRRVFRKAASTIFKVFYDLQISGTYTDVVDNGFDLVSTEIYPIIVIKDKFTKEDLKNLSFSKYIQPTDVKGLVEGVSVSFSLEIGNTITLDSQIYTIVALETDPAEALWILLLRKV